MTALSKLSDVIPSFMQTFSGASFTPAEPNPDTIHIEDIANALARQCRYGGHCLKFYSVAEHCCHVSDKASLVYKLSGLMHDASEAYLVDIPRPVKPLLQNYYAVEDKLMRVISKKFDFIGRSQTKSNISIPQCFLMNANRIWRRWKLMATFGAAYIRRSA